MKGWPFAHILELDEVDGSARVEIWHHCQCRLPAVHLLPDSKTYLSGDRPGSIQQGILDYLVETRQLLAERDFSSLSLTRDQRTQITGTGRKAYWKSKRSNSDQSDEEREALAKAAAQQAEDDLRLDMFRWYRFAAPFTRGAVAGRP